MGAVGPIPRSARFEVTVERIPVESSMLRSVGFDAESETLELEFHKGDVWQYFGVPVEVYEHLMKADSHGSYATSFIIGSYAEQRVSRGR